MTTLTKLKDLANQRRIAGGGEVGYADGVVDGSTVLVTAVKWGSNKPRRADHVRYTVTVK